MRPSLAGVTWTTALPRSVKLRDKQVVKQLHGLAWKDTSHEVPLSFGWYATEGIEVRRGSPPSPPNTAHRRLPTPTAASYRRPR